MIINYLCRHESRLYFIINQHCVYSHFTYFIVCNLVKPVQKQIFVKLFLLVCNYYYLQSFLLIHPRKNQMMSDQGCDFLVEFGLARFRYQCRSQHIGGRYFESTLFVYFFFMRKHLLPESALNYQILAENYDIREKNNEKSRLSLSK